MINALKYFKPPFKYENLSQTIYTAKSMCLQVRGWGSLIGGAANNLPVDDAKKIQDEFGDWVAKLMNDAVDNVSEQKIQQLMERTRNFDQRVQDLLECNNRYLERARDAEAAMRQFCDRVDAGEVRSTKTYNQFKEILGRKK